MLGVFGSILVNTSSDQVFKFFASMEQFPTYMDDIEKIDVLQTNKQDSDCMTSTTRWTGKIGDASVSWVLDNEHVKINNLRETYTVNFSLVENDDSPFSDFHGNWQFSPHQTGTLIRLVLEFEFPAHDIENELGDYLSELIETNVKSMLLGLAKKFPGVEAEPLTTRVQNSGEKETGYYDVVLLGHPSSKSHREKIFTSKYNLTSNKSKTLSSFSDVIPSHITDRFNDISDIRIAYATCPFVPSENTPLQVVRQKIKEGLEVARKSLEPGEKSIVALGGFTSIIVSEKTRQVYRDLGVHTTTGSTLTALSILRNVEEAATWKGLDLEDVQLTVIGAAGSIGSRCVPLLAQQVGHIVLTGRQPQKLQNLVDRYSITNASIFSNTENKAAVRGSNIVVTITSSAEPIIAAADCDPGTIICDAGFPKNVTDNNPNVLVFPGGLMLTPYQFDFSVDTGLPTELFNNRVLYGCWTEGILLGLAKRYDFELEMLEAAGAILEIEQIAKRFRFAPLPISKILEMKQQQANSILAHRLTNLEPDQSRIISI